VPPKRRSIDFFRSLLARSQPGNPLPFSQEHHRIVGMVEHVDEHYRIKVLVTER
jgi:hypothetical protein